MYRLSLQKEIPGTKFIVEIMKSHCIVRKSTLHLRGKKKPQLKTVVGDIMESALERPINHLVKTYFFQKIFETKIHRKLER